MLVMYCSFKEKQGFDKVCFESKVGDHCEFIVDLLMTSHKCGGFIFFQIIFLFMAKYLRKTEDPTVSKPS